MPYQHPTVPGFAIVEVDDIRLPGIESDFVENPPILLSDTRDSINSAGPYFLPVFINQVLSPVLTWNEHNTSASIPNLAIPGMDFAIALTDAWGIGFVVGVKLSWFAMNCLFSPVLPLPLGIGELPVVVYAVDGVISRSSLHFTLVYLLSHDQAALFYAVLGHAGMFSPHWQPFRAGERKTEDPPTIFDDDGLESSARCLRQMPLADLEKLEIHVNGFLHVQNALAITDMGFLEGSPKGLKTKMMISVERMAYSHSWTRVGLDGHPEPGRNRKLVAVVNPPGSTASHSLDRRAEVDSAGAPHVCQRHGGAVVLTSYLLLSSFPYLKAPDPIHPLLQECSSHERLDADSRKRSAEQIRKGLACEPLGRDAARSSEAGGLGMRAITTGTEPIPHLEEKWIAGQVGEIENPAFSGIRVQAGVETNRVPVYASSYDWEINSEGVGDELHFSSWGKDSQRQNRGPRGNGNEHAPKVNVCGDPELREMASMSINGVVVTWVVAIS
ncbi:hypothetical protein IW262DRAFT_1295675 [Armillaria fumosa]|nr:hypothetical protein IW262DRAFT_1295675 [Armillaria fumosa]